MFCRNCGKELIRTPEICLGCGAKPLVGNSFCQVCGVQTNPLAEICMKCGARLAKAVSPAERAWMPMTAGILSIVAGVSGLFEGIMVAVLRGVIGALEWISGLGAISGLWIIGTPFIAIGIVAGIVAIIGGVFALRKKVWGLALAGAICSIPCSWILAIPAIVFVTMSKQEFK